MVPIDSDYSSSGDEGSVPPKVVPKVSRVEVDWNRQQSTSDDEQSGNILDREYTGMFEGPEKTLEVVFRLIGGDDQHIVRAAGDLSEIASGAEPIHRSGLRCLSREDLDRICARARCTILSVASNRYLDAYVLSESSLFVYPYM